MSTPDPRVEVDLPGNAAIFFHPEGFDTTSPKLMGRHAAGEGFLRGWFRHGGFEDLHCQVGDLRHAQAFGEAAQAQSWRGKIHVHQTDRPETLAGVGAVLMPGPNLGQQTWHRRCRVRPNAYSVVGLTHTTASANALDNIGDLLISPLESWDALICTTEAVKTMVVRTLTDQAAYLAQRFSLPPSATVTLPQLPVIPLGVDCERFAPRPDLRQSWRERLSIGESDVVVLFMGRLSFHAKAHPMAMYQALQDAVPSLPAGARLHLIEAGWFGGPHIQEAFARTVPQICPDVVHHLLDGREPAVRTGIWHAADIFCSLSDNIQETFGLTPVEAMATGLPCVVSDWNGYKETVRDGVDGFRVPTWMLPPPFGADIAVRHAFGTDSYDLYCGKSCQFVSVDVAATTQAFRSLIADPDLRRRMGAAGRQRSQQVFDWKVVIASYKELMTDLSARRAAAGMAGWTPPPAGRQWPLRPDPFWSFAHYPTHLLGGATRVTATGLSPERLELIYTNGMVTYAHAALPTLPALKQVLALVSEQPGADVTTLAATADLATGPILPQALLFLAKYDFVRLSP
ncbi:hypothetical protein CHU95_21810 [Niveispirillum lacus]|uniref:Glycosyl transferase family 1 domain-containing protein n=1 Tax=Niveispirillum lacus TaxID=1981099 RepID=A0A255YRB3_9PROT|nr:glycosyltransferase family 4 protein [Niveispirillum lacus]OYQ31766.1 hypothetical protein CHU95_21810 [Niveispirillum lacus]